MTRRGAPG